MVVYVDGKPIFVQNPKPTDNSATSRDENESRAKCSPAGVSPKSSSYKPVAKIPYLLAAAAAAAASNHRKQQQQQQNQAQTSVGKQISTDCARSSTYPIIQANSKTNANNNNNSSSSSKCKSGELKQDTEYMQLVSLLKQKNEKLFNPLLHKTF